MAKFSILRFEEIDAILLILDSASQLLQLGKKTNDEFLFFSRVKFREIWQTFEHPVNPLTGRYDRNTKSPSRPIAGMSLPGILQKTVAKSVLLSIRLRFCLVSEFAKTDNSRQDRTRRTPL